MTRAGRNRAAAALLALALPAAASGQRDDHAPLVLQMPASARATGLAGAFVAVRDIESILANPAFAGVVTGTAISAERFRASRAGTLASSMALGQFGVAVSVQYLDFTASPVEVFCDNVCFPSDVYASSAVLNTGDAAAAASLAAAVGISTTYKGFRWGGAFKYAEQRVGQRRGTAPAVDLGVAKEGGRISWGLAVQNLGPDLESETANPDLPMRATLGMAGGGLPVGPLDFALSLAVSVLRDGFVSPAGGMEWSYTPLEGYTFVARLGMRRPELEELRPLTLGASFTFDRLSIDYAFDDVRGGAGHRFGLRVR